MFLEIKEIIIYSLSERFFYFINITKFHLNIVIKQTQKLFILNEMHHKLALLGIMYSTWDSIPILEN